MTVQLAVESVSRLRGIRSTGNLLVSPGVYAAIGGFSGPTTYHLRLCAKQHRHQQHKESTEP